MAKDIFDTILEKDYYQLTSSELTEIAEFCKTEEEFLAMKHVLAHSKSIAEGPKLSPKEATKEKLDNLFDSTYGKSKKFVPFYLNPFVQIAAVVVIGFAVWLFVSKSDNLETVHVAENTVIEEKEKPLQKENQNQTEETDNLDLNNLYGYTYDGKKFKDEVSFEQKNKNTKAEIPEPSHKIGYDGYGAGGKPFFESEISRRMMEEKVYEVAIAETGPDFSTSEDVTMDVSAKKEEKTFSKVSAPASSVRDISVDASKSPYKNQTVTSMNVAEQKNVMNYLVARY